MGLFKWNDLSSFFSRSIKKLKQALPITPNKRAAVLSAYVDCNRILKSPGVKKIHDSFEESVEKMAIRNIQDVITSVKHKRNGEAKAALNILTSSVSGENISDRKRATKSLANILGVNSRTLQKGKKIEPKSCIQNTRHFFTRLGKPDPMPWQNEPKELFMISGFNQMSADQQITKMTSNE